jgi:gallate decarboxylase subunit C
MFRDVRRFSVPVVAGLLSSRRRAALLLGSSVERVAFDLLNALDRALPPEQAHEAPCRQTVLRPPFDIRNILPIPTHTELDAGPFITAGLVRARDPETGEADVTIHRIGVQGPDRLSIYFVPGRRIDRFRARAEHAGRALPVSVNIGLDPAIYFAACMGPPAAPAGLDELRIAGGIRRRPVRLADCVSVDEKAIADAEIVIEGEILPGVRTSEDALTGRGCSMPEFHGYMGIAEPEVPVMQVTAITHRRDPIFQAIIGPAQDRTQLIGIPAEAGTIRVAGATAPGLLRSVYAHEAGAGSLLSVLQVSKAGPEDDERSRAMALACFDHFRQLRAVALVDDDVNIFDPQDLLWAMATRCEGQAGFVFSTGSPLRFLGGSSRTVVDATVPWSERSRLRRVRFAPVDPSRFSARSAEDRLTKVTTPSSGTVK